MSNRYLFYQAFVLALTVLASILCASRVVAVESSNATPPNYAGYYSRGGNNEKLAQASGHNEYVRFYPQSRIVRLYIPFPYAKTVTPDEINLAFKAAFEETTGSAYIKSKFGVMDKPVVAYLDVYRVINDQIMYDCGKSKPCKVIFNDDSMVVTRPGIVMEQKTRYRFTAD